MSGTLQRWPRTVAATAVVVVILTITAWWVGYLIGLRDRQPGWQVVIGAPMISVGLVVALKLVQVRRPYRFRRRSALAWLDETIDRSVFGAGALVGWTRSNPQVSLADLQGREVGLLPRSPTQQAPPRPTSNGREALVPYTVARGDSFWSLAEALLGDGGRWAELHELNVGTEVAPGVLLGEADLLTPGWVIMVPDTEED